MDQQPLTINERELGAKFGAQLGQIFSELIAAEKMITSQSRQIQAMTRREANLVEHIQDLESELARMKRAWEPPLSAAAAEIAAEGAAIVAEAREDSINEKAPSDGG
jgi:cell division protein FtsB